MLTNFFFKLYCPKKVVLVMSIVLYIVIAMFVHYNKAKCHFFVEAAEHEKTSIITNKYIKDFQVCFSYQLIICDFDINFYNFNILSKDFNRLGLFIWESLLIACCDNLFL